MSTLIILLLSFLISLALNKYAFHNRYSSSTLGRFALAVMLLFTGTSHFFKTDEMVQMMPGLLPYKTGLVYATGVLELLAAAGLLIQRWAKMTSVALILFFVLILPANIIGSMKRVELGGMENGPSYLYFRIPFQMLLIWWAYYFGIRLLKEAQRKQSELVSHA